MAPKVMPLHWGHRGTLVGIARLDSELGQGEG